MLGVYIYFFKRRIRSCFKKKKNKSCSSALNLHFNGKDLVFKVLLVLVFTAPRYYYSVQKSNLWAACRVADVTVWGNYWAEIPRMQQDEKKWGTKRRLQRIHNRAKEI